MHFAECYNDCHTCFLLENHMVRLTPRACVKSRSRPLHALTKRLEECALNKDWMALYQQQNQLDKLIGTNQKTERYGLALTEQDAKLILEERKNSLQEQKRVEFGEGIVPKIIYEFCDSSYIDQNNYVTTIIRLQEIFYLYKNEMQDEITDDELLHLMKEQFELLCFGDLDYLESTCLANFSQAIRAGYEGYKGTDGYGEYSKFDDTERWDYGLYRSVLAELCEG